MKKVLITGIDGFTGVYLERLLQEAGYEVYGTSYPKSTDKRHVLCNIADKQAIISVLGSVRPDYLVHLAGISFVPHSDVKQVYDINFFSTVNFLDALLELGLSPEKIVLASSSNVYGNPNIGVIDETVCPMPITHYAISKLAMEFIARTYFEKLNILITRPFNYTGIGQQPQFLIPKIVHHYKDEKTEIELGNLDVVRDFSDVRFVAEVYKRLMECSETSEVVNVCSGRGISLKDVLAIMNSLCGYRIAVKTNNDFIRKNEILTHVGSNKKLVSMIGAVQIRSFEDTLQWMLGKKENRGSS